MGEVKQAYKGDRTMKDKILQWYATGQRGASSEAMAACFLGYPSDGSSPCDPADLNRCLLFLDMVPEARQKMDELRPLSPTWNKLVDRWDELELAFYDEVGVDWCKARSAPKTYALMQKIMHG